MQTHPSYVFPRARHYKASFQKNPLECVYIKCGWRVRAYTQVAQAGTNCDHTAHTTVFQLHIKVRFGEAATTTERQLAGQNGEQT